ncbi:hypothetical protein H6F43_07695 [Leptolyngbya sp. FACHB-36]|uniref:extracellular catalytic domain type 1 short-chain-length polyhydroxyalkanoate depolymerase n=1 Tax=Leptolyngbya sp. FACHB-36 TaxID=2692808 RepID=UPI001680D7FB|nr:PHB depolymerase family esterase [Leptolyngbya sp. FACHB-36]MBD2020068.1 hypothetical protein [Leptolyngbya sp. FACHB-36]
MKTGWGTIAALSVLGGLLTSCQSNQHASTSHQSDAASAAQPVKLGASDGELVHDGQRRTYSIYTPKSYRGDRPLPLVLAFHGYGSQGKDLATGSGMNDIAEQKGFLVVYPDGIERRWNPLHKALTGVDDVAFVPALIAHLKQERAINSRRIYAAGVSNGGFLVQRLACDQAKDIAAFASVVSSFPSQLQAGCRPQAPVPMLMINGTSDDKVPWQGGNLPYGSLLSVPQTIELWKQHNACPDSAQVKRLAGDRIEVSRYSNCRSGAEVELVALKGAGHVYPRGGGGSSSLLDGSQEIWNFFERHRLR